MSVATIEKLCTRSDLLNADEMSDRADAEIHAGGESASRALANLICDLVHSRSARISYALFAAANAVPTAELAQALKLVSTEPSLRFGTPGRFTPEIVGGGQIGWSDATHNRIKNLASEALERLHAPQVGVSSG